MAPSPPIRRNNGSTPKPSTTITISQTSSSTTPGNPLLALLPTPHETLLLSLYPLLLLLGSLYSLLSPTTRNAPYDPLTQSHPPSHAPSYFALKHNILNDYFVKIAWFWVSLAYTLFLTSHPSTAPAWVLTPKRVQGALRWVIVTAWWAGVTQWFFGPGLIDRGFAVTGGVCRVAEKLEGGGGRGEVWSSKACKAVGGEWRGGHDVSGHVFILVLGSAFLMMEVLPAVLRGSRMREERRVKTREGGVGVVESGNEDEMEEGGWVGWGVGGVAVVVGLSWWMLLMTAAFFHTWFEKFTGLLTAFSALFVVYFLPRLLPSVRDVIGMPGI